METVLTVPGFKRLYLKTNSSHKLGLRGARLVEIDDSTGHTRCADPIESVCLQPSVAGYSRATVLHLCHCAAAKQCEV